MGYDLTAESAPITTETIWDDTDIVHVVRDEIVVPDFHTYGGLRLQSSPTESLVIKLDGELAGFTAGGQKLDINDRIGGTLQVLGTPGHPVVMTSLYDATVGAGFDLSGQPQNETAKRNASINFDISKSPGYEAEPTIAIDPTNAARMFAASNVGGDSLFAAYSIDGGVTWATRLIADGTDGLPQACCDPVASWDQFGNLFLTYLNVDHDAVIVLRSIDGGKTFTLAANIPADDQPTITTGPGATPGSGSVWVTFNQNGGIRVAGAAVTGFNAVGAFGPTQTVPTSVGNFGDIAVGPNGQVMVTWQNPTGNEGPADIFVSLDADGLGTGGFNTPRLVTTMNVGGFDFVPAQRSEASTPKSAWPGTAPMAPTAGGCT